MAGSTWNCCHLGSCSVYTSFQCHSVPFVLFIAYLSHPSRHLMELPRLLYFLQQGRTPQTATWTNCTNNYYQAGVKFVPEVRLLCCDSGRICSGQTRSYHSGLVSARTESLATMTDNSFIPAESKCTRNVTSSSNVTYQIL